MLIKKTFIAPSAIHGIGLFAAEVIEENELVWIPGFEELYTQNQFEEFSPLQQACLLHYGWKDIHDGLWHLSLDNDRFTNHSFEPTLKLDEKNNVVAAKRIEAGDEMTVNYLTFIATVTEESLRG
jgi:SET domain-containing protein